MSENYFWNSVKLNLIFSLRLRKHGFCFSLNYGNIVLISLELELYISELNMNLKFLFYFLNQKSIVWKVLCFIKREPNINYNVLMFFLDITFPEINYVLQ